MYQGYSEDLVRCRRGANRKRRIAVHRGHGLAVGLLLLAGCAQLRQEMERAERAYERERYKDALTWLEELEQRVPDMEPSMRVRFYYLRGMTAYALDRRDDALHYLALAREEAKGQQDALPPQWTRLLETRLAELTPNQRGTFHARPRSASSGSEDAAPSPSDEPRPSS